jgi:hypothetical protein
MCHHKLIIEQGPTGDWKVTIGNRWEERLTSDEALWCAAQFLMNGGPPNYLKTAEQHAAWKLWIEGLPTLPTALNP